VGDVTILVNNAAVVHGKSLMDSDDDALLKSQHINTLGQFWVSLTHVTFGKIPLCRLSLSVSYFDYKMAVYAVGSPDLSIMTAIMAG